MRDTNLARISDDFYVSGTDGRAASTTACHSCGWPVNATALRVCAHSVRPQCLHKWGMPARFGVHCSFLPLAAGQPRLVRHPHLHLCLQLAVRGRTGHPRLGECIGSARNAVHHATPSRTGCTVENLMLSMPHRGMQDMFHSRHSAARLHAIARVVSGESSCWWAGMCALRQDQAEFCAQLVDMRLQTHSSLLLTHTYATTSLGHNMCFLPTHLPRRPHLHLRQAWAP